MKHYSSHVEASGVHGATGLGLADELSTLSSIKPASPKGPMPGKESRRIRVMAFNNNFYRLNMLVEDYSEPYNEFRDRLKTGGGD